MCHYVKQAIAIIRNVRQTLVLKTLDLSHPNIWVKPISFCVNREFRDVTMANELEPYENYVDNGSF